MCKKTCCKRGLKDHEIQGLVNSVRDAVNKYLYTILCSNQAVRQVILGAVMGYLEENNLRIDNKNKIKDIK